jgi:hypothetical protein
MFPYEVFFRDGNNQDLPEPLVVSLILPYVQGLGSGAGSRKCYEQKAYKKRVLQ